MLWRAKAHVEGFRNCADSQEVYEQMAENAKSMREAVRRCKSKYLGHNNQVCWRYVILYSSTAILKQIEDGVYKSISNIRFVSKKYSIYSRMDVRY